jgi:uncharacterized protein (DUF2147 family)
MISILLAALAAAHPGPARIADPVVGTWMNPKGTVAVRTARCGGGLCGRVVWASAAAQEAAQAGGTERLVGTDLFRDVRPVGPGAWEGEVLVPDLGTTADGNLMLLGPDRLEIDGCRLNGLLCRKQVWHKIAALPRGR